MKKIFIVLMLTTLFSVKNMKKIVFVLTLMLSLGAFAEAKNDTPQYEIKSDILNFDYTNLGYPTKEWNIGIPVSNTQAPRKLVKGKPEEVSVTASFAEGLLQGGIGMFFLVIINVPYIVILMIAYLAIDAYGNRKEKRREAARRKKEAESLGLKIELR